MNPFEEARARLANVREAQATKWEELERTITELERIVGRATSELNAVFSRCAQLEAALVPSDLESEGHICEPLAVLRARLFEAREGGRNA